MGLELRIASAKGVLLAGALVLAGALPAFAACVPFGTSLTVDQFAPSPMIGIPTDAQIVGTPDGVLLRPSGTNLPLNIFNTATIGPTGQPDGVALDQSDTPGTWAAVCYVGDAAASINVLGNGIHFDTSGPGVVELDLAHNINAGETGILIQRWEAGNVTVTTAAGTTIAAGAMGWGAPFNPFLFPGSGNAGVFISSIHLNSDPSDLVVENMGPQSWHRRQEFSHKHTDRG